MDLTPLAPRARWLFHLNALVRLLFLGPPLCIGAGIGLSFVVSPLVAIGIAGALGLLMTIAAIWFPSLAFDRWGYTLTERELMIQHGVIVRQLTAIPSGRIQHVDTHQGPIDQLMRLASVHVYTASGLGSDGVIPGLDLAEAERLRDRLMATEGDDGV